MTAGAITFLVGGARSGKSTLAVEIGVRHVGHVVFVATAVAFDDDMRDRIDRHRDERPDWPTVEAPVDLAAAVRSAPADALVIVDCLTVWLGNLLHAGADDLPTSTAAVIEALTGRSGPSVVVSNEVGMGIHPESDLGRRYRDDLGRLNQSLAAVAATSLLVVAGRAVRLRDPWELL
ncbi:MAG: cobP [Ilumatobacteraceae bacterium]|nr:cobP [Ilumatobacteraceae bacterium]